MAHGVCPWWLGYFLASPLRRWFQDPGAVVGPFVREGIVVSEPGPGMGFFTLEMARRVGDSGRVIAVDIQPKMIEGLVRRAAKAGRAGRIDARVASGDGLGVGDCAGAVDFALVYAMVHEVPDQAALFRDLHAALKAGGKLLLTEPAGHVSMAAFDQTLVIARGAGFAIESRAPGRRSRTAVLVRG